MATHDVQLATALRDAWEGYAAAGDDGDEALIGAENALFARLDVPLNQTEQGPTREALETIYAFCQQQIGWRPGEAI